MKSSMVALIVICSMLGVVNTPVLADAEEDAILKEMAASAERVKKMGEKYRQDLENTREERKRMKARQEEERKREAERDRQEAKREAEEQAAAKSDQTRREAAARAEKARREAVSRAEQAERARQAELEASLAKEKEVALKEAQVTALSNLSLEERKARAKAALQKMKLQSEPTF